MNILEQNTIEVLGKVVSTPVLSHTVYKEKFYVLDLEVDRLSESVDVLPVLISEKLMADVAVGTYVKITGQMRTYNKMENKSRKLLIYIFTRDIDVVTEEYVKNYKLPNNDVTLVGFVCKEPVYRTTPFGRVIADLLIAVNRSYSNSDYIPCIAWGRNAKYAKTFEVGQKVEIKGRFQSRDYTKKDADGNVTTKKAYELSILNITAL